MELVKVRLTHLVRCCLPFIVIPARYVDFASTGNVVSIVDILLYLLL